MSGPQLYLTIPSTLGGKGLPEASTMKLQALIEHDAEADRNSSSRIYLITTSLATATKSI